VTGCFNLRGNLEVGRDAKISGKLTGEINKQLAAMAGITSKDALVAQMTNNTELFPAGTSVTETDDAYVMERTLWDVTMQDPEGFSVSRSGEEIVFQLTFAQQEAATEDDLGLGNLELGRVNLTMVPGDIIQVSQRVP
jgi:hypothetical protein